MITTINEFRKHYNSINEMSYASLQSEIDDLEQQLAQLFTDQENEAGQKGDQWTDTDANRYGVQMNKIERKIQTRKNYIDRLRSGSRKSTPTKELVQGEKINYKGEECTILYVIAPDTYEVKVSKQPAIVGLASPSNTTYNNSAVKVTNVEGKNIFVNTWKDGGGFNNFAKKINVDQLDGVIVVPYAELQSPTKEPRTSKEPKAKPNMEVKNAIRTLNKNIDSVKPSIDKFKDRTAEQQASIFKGRFHMLEDITTIVTALQQMGLIQQDDNKNN